MADIEADTFLYEKRKGVFPKAVDGFFRRFKWAIMAVTLTIYYATPWIRWDRGPYAPDQAVLIDLAHRRFYMFDIEIWPHEFYYVAGMLIMAGIGLFLVTSAVGRAWCGYSLPADRLDRPVPACRPLHRRRPQCANRVCKRRRGARRRFSSALAKWSIYLVISFWTGGAWIMYFADAPTLTRDFWTRQCSQRGLCDGRRADRDHLHLRRLHARTGVHLHVPLAAHPDRDDRRKIADRHLQGMARRTAWFGEKGRSAARFGSATASTATNALRSARPASTSAKGRRSAASPARLCIDACDKVMAQIGRPRGLIDYLTLDDVDTEKKGGTAHPTLKTLFRPRTLIYFGIWSAIGLAMLFTLGQRTRLDLTVQHDRNPLFVRLSDGTIRNNYTVKVRNMETRDREVSLIIKGLPGAVAWTQDGSRENASQRVKVKVSPDSVQKVRLFVAAPEAGPQRTDFEIARRSPEWRRKG